MKRVLVITYYWPPTGGSGVQRWVKFAKYLPSEGWEPVIYTPENPERTSYDETLLADVSPSLEIVRRPIMEPYNLYRRLLGKGASTDLKTLTAKAASDGDVVTPISSGRKSLKQRLSLWIRANVFVPDPRVTWLRPSVLFLKKYLKEHPVDVIVTTGPPQSMHLIGERLHKDLGIPWVADFRDPWTKMYYLKHLPLTKRSWRRLHEMEEKVAREASAVLTVTPMVRDYFKGLTSRPVPMITNGYDAENSKVFWPQVKDAQGRVFHLSTVCAATMLAVDQSANSLSPCSATWNACMDFGLILRRSDSLRRRRAESSTVPDPITCSLGKPEYFQTR